MVQRPIVDSLIVAALAVLVLAGVGLVTLFPPAVRLAVMPLLCLVTAALVAWIACRQLPGSDGRMRVFRRLMVIGSGFWSAGNVLWLLIDPFGVPRLLVDICFMCAYVPLLGTSVALVRRDTGNPDRLRMLLDVLVQLLGSGMILWALGLAISPELMSNLVYLLVDLAMFSILISVCAMRHAVGLWPGMFAIIGGMLTALFGDVLVVGGWASLPMEDGGWIGVVILAQGYWYGLSARLLPVTDPSVTRSDPVQSRGQVVSLLIALLIALAAIVLVSRSGMPAGTGVLLSILLLAVLMVARALLDQRELARVIFELRQAHFQLQNRVEESTRDLHLASSERQVAVRTAAEERQFAESLREVVATVAGSEDLRSALQAVLAVVRRSGKVSAAAVMFVDDGVARVVCHDGYTERSLGPWLEALAVPVEIHPAFSRMFNLGETVYQNQAQELPEWSLYPELSWVGSYLGVSLRARGRTYGFINVVSESTDAFPRELIERMRAIADSVALALENARLLARTRRRLEKLSLVLEVGTALNEQADLFAAMREALWRFVQAADLGALVVAGGPVERPWGLIAAFGIDADEVQADMPRAALAEAGLLTGGWSVIGDPLDDLRLADPRLAYLRGLVTRHARRMLVVVPLRLQNRLHGVLVGFAHRELSSAEGEQLRLLGTLIAARLEADLRLEAERSARAMAEEASRLKGEFLANTSHELRTPLTGILLSLELAQDQTLDDEAARRDLLDTAHHSGTRLLGMINGLLDLAKIEAGRLETRPERMDPLAAVGAVFDTLRPVAQQRQLVLVLTGWHGEPGAVWADPSLVHQILTNLIGNALKFTEIGGVEVGVERQVQHACIRIADSGVGLTQAELERLFQPFVQADGSSTRRYEGTGLGLVIARRMAERMGGSLELFSEGPGHGSRAEIRLPLAP